MKVVIPEAVLFIILKCRLEKKLLILNIVKFVHKSLVHRLSFSHMLKGFQEDLIKIPVDQIVLIPEVPIKCLPCSTAFLHDLFHRDLLYRRPLHTSLHRLRQAVFHFFIISACLRHCTSTPLSSSASVFKLSSVFHTLYHQTKTISTQISFFPVGKYRIQKRSDTGAVTVPASDLCC